jgi:hypothetical protein
MVRRFAILFLAYLTIVGMGSIRNYKRVKLMPWKSIVLLGKFRVRFMSSKNTESAKNEASPECFLIPHGIAGDSAKAIVGLRPSFSAHVSGFPARGATNIRMCGFH